MKGYKMTEEKIKKAKPIIERALSRKYGRDIKLHELTIGGVTFKEKEVIR